jgi:uncharacterized protein (DUF1697 family)
MNTYVSILRGINVNGKNSIRMNDLKTLYEQLKFMNVTTYIQSGNVIFRSDTDLNNYELSKQIEKAVFKNFQLKIPVILRNYAELQQTIKNNPFLKEKGINFEKLHVTFLSEKPVTKDLLNITQLNYYPDKFVISETEVYLYCPNGYGTTKLSNVFFENKLNVTATTRNWNTILKLENLCKEIV